MDGVDGFVPGLSIWVAFILLLTSVGAFIYYIDHMAHAIRATTVVANIASETHEAIDRLYPDILSPDVPGDGAPGVIRSTGRAIVAGKGGLIVGIDEAAIVALTGKEDRQLELLGAIGDFVPAGATLLWFGGFVGRQGGRRSPRRDWHRRRAHARPGRRVRVSGSSSTSRSGRFRQAQTTRQRRSRLSTVFMASCGT